MIDERHWQRAVEVLRGSRQVTLACHLHPDGDALGSMLALGLALRALGLDVSATFDGAPYVQPAYTWLPGLDLLRSVDDLPGRCDVLVSLDSSTEDRLGRAAAALSGAAEVLVVDHHSAGREFGTIRLVDPGAAATAVLVADLVDRLGVELTEDIALGIYTGLATDTGSFRYQGTTPQVHALAGRLLAAGVRPDVVSRQVWETSTFGYVRLLGRALDRATLEPAAVAGAGLVWTWTEAVELDEFGLMMPEIEGFIDAVRLAGEADVAAIVKGDADGTYKVSLRSRGRIDVGALCHELGGGGHRFAAGYTSTSSVPATIATLRRALTAAPHLPE